MKKAFLMVFTLCLGMACFTSCGDDDEPWTGGNQTEGKDSTATHNDTDTVVNPVDTVVNPDVTPANEEWAPTKQQAYLEDVALEMNSIVQAEDFRHYIELASYVNDTYIDGSDWDNVEDWADDILDDLMSDLIKKETNTERYENSWGSYVYNDIISYYKSTILASNFKGHWIVRNGKWSRTDAEDIQFAFANKAGNQCILTLTTSGKVVKCHLFDLDDWKDYQPIYDNDNYIGSNEYLDRTQYTLGVPEHITVTLTEGGTTLVKQTLDIDLSGITNDEFNLSSSSLGFNSVTTLSNGYVFNTKNVKYSSSSTSATTTVEKNGRTLIVTTFSTGLSGIPNQILTGLYDMDDDDIEDLFAHTTTTNAAFSVDILGKVQVKGTISDAHQLIDYLDKADDNDKDEFTFKQAVANANKCYKANIYYNGGITKQAYMSIEPLSDNYYDWMTNSYNTKWEMEPTINFHNGTSYSFEEYFNEDAFKKLIDAIEDQGDNAEDMWD